MKQAPRGMVKDGQGAAPVAPRTRSPAVLLALAICAGLVFATFFALGTWQLKRLQWKLDLIERVEQRVHAPAVAAPGPERWPQINADADEYRRVRLSGTFLYALTARVQASTELGGGFWLLTPLRTADGSVVLVNRGFVPAKADVQSGTPEVGPAEVSGLLRMSEPGGGFLRHNDPAADRWYSRDVQAIASARGLSPAAPYFIDADAATASHDTGGNRPVGGLTVIAFHNNHLVYALTWYALALMVAGACFWVGREERNLRRRSAPSAAANADGIDRESEDGK
ncbi:SURF1 family protein [Collimonas fungivorans]|uniref:SURF1-like protein n=1 Tax=Collimonas fungivorans (strain Ter331) TaxID=1005048 RepID=G0AKA4_COLFT|nr:SURF1 family protein [Collimonas fungivorans]AEK62031.1 Cytochrome oxidase biogenesis protein Surf1, facilitates heme A insertion [Collimonas fungivorans Ter331]